MFRLGSGLIDWRGAGRRTKEGTLMQTFTFYTDPGHGWLAVRVQDLRTAGLSAADFTPCSHVSGDGCVLFLEEDCDAPKFLEVYKARHGREAQIVDRYDGEFVRRLPCNVAGRWWPFASVR